MPCSFLKDYKRTALLQSSGRLQRIFVESVKKDDRQNLKSSALSPSPEVLLASSIWIAEIISCFAGDPQMQKYGSTSELAISERIDGASWLN